MGRQPGQGDDGDGAGRDPAPPGRDPRLARYAADGAPDAPPPAPSGRLALLIDQLSGPGRRCPGADDDELVGLLRAWAAIESWAAAAKLGVIREMMRRDALPSAGGGGRGVLPGTWSASLRYELAAALACSTQSADGVASLAWQLAARLSRIGARLGDGILTQPKARAVADVFEQLTDADAADAEAMIADQLGGKTYGQVLRLAEEAALTVDPALAERRREQAQKRSARVSFFREQAGTAALSGRDLPPDEALAAMASVNARAGQYKESDAFGDTPMDVLRAYAYLDLIKGATAAERIAAAEPQDDAADAAESLAWARARAAARAAEEAKAAAKAKATAEARAGNGARPGPDPDGGGQPQASPDRDEPGTGEPPQANPDPRDRPGQQNRANPGTGGPGTGEPDARRADAVPPNPPDPGEDGSDIPADPDDCSCTDCDGSCLVGDYDLDDGEPDDGDPGGEGDPGGGPDFGGPGPGGPGLGGPVPGPGAPPTGQDGPSPPADLVVPLATLLGLAERPGDIHGFGLLDPALARKLAAAGAASPRTEVCVTVTSAQGHAIGHGCARPARRPHPAAPPAALTELPARLNLTIPAAALPGLPGRASPTGPAGTDDRENHAGSWAFAPRGKHAGTPGGFGTWTLTLPGGRELTVRLDPVPTHSCDHRYESHSYQPSDRLRHLVQIRDGTCTFPPCNRHARDSDFEHAIPYEKGGRTCTCNAGARSRACHRVKQSRGWEVTQPKPGWHRWQTPAGQIYVQEPKRYPA